MNRMMKMELTYYRTGVKQRLDMKAVHPEGKGEWRRSVVLTESESFAVRTLPDANQYSLEYIKRGPERSEREPIQGHVFVNASRYVDDLELKDVLLGNEFQVVNLRAEPARDAIGDDGDRVIAEVRRIKTPKSSRIARHIVRATLELVPSRDYRLAHYAIAMNDGYVLKGTIEYGDTPGKGLWIPRKFVQDIRKDGVPHKRLETYTIIEMSLDNLPNEIFTLKAFGIDSAKPTESSSLLLLFGGVGLVLAGIGIFLHARRSRPELKRPVRVV
jgi:hypothetical protein